MRFWPRFVGSRWLSGTSAVSMGCTRHGVCSWHPPPDARCTMHDVGCTMLGCSDARMLVLMQIEDSLMFKSRQQNIDADWGFTHVQMSPAKSYKDGMCVCVCGQCVVCVACVVMCCLYTKLSPIPEQYVLRSHTTGRSPTICIVICYVCCICVQCHL